MDTLKRGNGACPWRPWAGWVMGLLFTAMMVCLLFDREAEKLLRVLAWAGLVVAAVTDGHARGLKHLWKALAAWCMVMAATAGAAWLWGDPGAAMAALFKYQVWLIWFAVIWIALPVFVHSTWRRPRSADEWSIRWAGWLGAVLLALCFYATLSAAASLFPKDSFELLGGELLPYAGMFVIIKRMAWCIDSRWWQAAARTSWGIVVVASLTMAGVMVLALLSRAWSDALLQAGLFRVDADAPGTRRLQFLFSHHNRAGYFSAVAIFLCLAGAGGTKAWRWLGIGGAAAAAFALPFTLTRGALVGAALAMLLFITGGALRHRRGGWILLAAIIVMLPAAWLALPQKYQQHISKITNPANYQEHAGGSIGARLVMWQTAAEMIEKRPGLGFGYGFENFESTARLEHPANPEYFAGASHAHNHWLETAAETGIPGALLLLALTALRIGGLTRAWWRSVRGRNARPDLAWLLMLWLCLELLIQFYGLTNYTLRRNLGFLTYWIWAGSVVLVLRAEYLTTAGAREPVGDAKP